MLIGGYDVHLKGISNEYISNCYKGSVSKRKQKDLTIWKLQIHRRHPLIVRISYVKKQNAFS